MSFILSAATFLISVFAFAQSGIETRQCFTLEGTRANNPLCVPAQNENCHSGQPGNCEVWGPKMPCQLYSGVGTYLAPEDSFRTSVKCVAYQDSICTGTGEARVCRPGPCKFYRPPECTQLCKPCYRNPITNALPMKGCVRLCLSKYCVDDEPTCMNGCDPNRDPNCLVRYNQICSSEPVITRNGIRYVFPKVQHDECKPDVTCPGSIPPPTDMPPEAQCCMQLAGDGTCAQACTTTENGQIVIPVTGATTCQPPVLEHETVPIQNKSCPWITMPPPTNRDPEATPQICSDIEEGNRFPQDCCVCTGGANISPSNRPCKPCGAVLPARCSQ